MSVTSATRAPLTAAEIARSCVARVVNALYSCTRALHLVQYGVPVCAGVDLRAASRLLSTAAMLTEGTDYLLYKHAYHTGGAITGLTNSEVSVVATRRFLFIIPQREVSLGLLSIQIKTYFPNNDKLAIQTAVEALVNEPALTVDALEAMLQEMLPPEHVYPLDALTKLSVWMLFRQVRFKRERGATQVLALKGRANHERFKAFYAGALR